ncbi:hypothetical protein SAMN04515674_10994 [Pseudarcicella hirudinis]|uniref:Uncharacterized protein n=1 Tax=Pseudarcicella hirudinis TaxID=1079859 RepID=A0A1I5VFX5_9BACT|nr:hypothetical protein [Pseudarcicella hirudinis]SFQ06395.1 hypothetical protein SAMN04515674_10994 [Pseudarcicella hirudinis]
MELLLSLRKFTEESQFIEMQELLKKNDILFETEVSNSSIDAVSLRQTLPEFIIKISQSDFLKANELLAEKAEHEIQEVDKNHYLFEFSDEELFDLISKPDEWSEFDYQLAKKILADRGQTINEDFLKHLNAVRIDSLSQPEKRQSGAVRAGYLFALLGGLIGLAIGWNLYTSKKTLPDGKSVFTYQQADRNHGLRIMIIGTMVFILLTFLKISSQAGK